MTFLSAPFLRRGITFEAQGRPALSRAAAGASAGATAQNGAARGGSVRFERIDKVYRSKSGDVSALAGIDVEVKPGSIFGIIGRSGAGKSSLIRLVNRLEAPTGGRVLVNDVDIAALDTPGLVGLRRRIGMIFQHFNLLSAKTVWDNIALPLVVAGTPRAEIGPRVERVLELVGLSDKRDVYPARLSGGQKQRVGIARALVCDPDILLCDEATSALDPETTLSILALLKDINRRLGLTIILITHEMSVIREICDTVLVLEQGRIVETGPVWRIFGDPQAEATRALLQPLMRDLPDDIALRLKTTRSGPTDHAVLALHYTGDGGEPDLAAIAAALDAPLTLLHAAIDRVQGRSHGRLIVRIAGREPSPETLAALAQDAKVIGYVRDHA